MSVIVSWEGMIKHMVELFFLVSLFKVRFSIRSLPWGS